MITPFIDTGKTNTNPVTSSFKLGSQFSHKAMLSSALKGQQQQAGLCHILSILFSYLLHVF